MGDVRVDPQHGPVVAREPRTNWSGSLRYSASRLAEPTTLDELAGAVTSAASVRPLGTRHAFNSIADTRGTQISLGRMPATFEPDEARGIVRIAAQLRYGDVGRRLQERGLALANLASLPHISVAGAVATATHGSGSAQRNLSAAVAGLQLMDAQGITHFLRRGDPDFAGAVVALGALGIVTHLDLDVEPSFTVTQHVYESLPWDGVQQHLAAVMASAYSVSLFTDWSDSGVQLAWVKERDGAPHDAELLTSLSAGLAGSARHPLPGGPVENATAQGVAGPWNERLPHFRLEFTPSSGEEIQSEYLVAAADAPAAIDALRGVADRIRPLLLVSEIRAIAADDLWMSTAHERDSIAFHFTWVRDVDGVAAAVPHLERALEPFAPRPHWGKVFAAGAATLAPRYPRWRDFRELVAGWDPERRFRNAFLASVLGD